PEPSDPNPQPSPLIPQPQILNPKPSTLTPQPSTLNPKPSTPQVTFGRIVGVASTLAGLVQPYPLQSTYPNTCYCNTYLPSTHTPSAGPRFPPARKYA
ncbi:hypothetical protein T484DRAFT_1650323, partial [Baffinella frigidus]